MTTRIRWTLLVAVFGVLTAGRAYAQTACATDLDCPDTACGGQVCTKGSGGAQCTPAGEQAGEGADGWCANAASMEDNNNCKCKAQGATCAGFYCTFTTPRDGSATGVGGSGGATGAGGTGTGGGAAGTTGGGGGGGGCSVAGPPAFGGAAGLALMLAAMIRRQARRR
jgi:hypothetical protein